MNNLKINLTILTQGASLMSEQECSKQLRKPVINKRGKYVGKQARDKRGNLLWYYERVPDLSKYERHDIEVETLDADKKKHPERITFFTRKQREAKQVINMPQEAYDYFISSEKPFGYRAPRDFKPTMPTRSRFDRKLKEWVDGVPIEVQAWRAASEKERLEWHLRNVAQSLGGVVDSYTVFND